MTQDYFVGFLSAACGCYLMFGAALDAAWLMGLRRPRLLIEALGKTAARWMLGAVGVALIALGGVIVSGWRMDWSWLLGKPDNRLQGALCLPLAQYPVLYTKY
jgi:hypothetical protein